MDGFGMDGCAADGLTGRRRSSTAADGGAAGSTVVLARGYHPEVTISSVPPWSTLTTWGWTCSIVSLHVQPQTHRIRLALDGEGQHWRRALLQNHECPTGALERLLINIYHLNTLGRYK